MIMNLMGAVVSCSESVSMNFPGSSPSFMHASGTDLSVDALPARTRRNRLARLRRWKRAYAYGARECLLKWSSVFLPIPPPPVFSGDTEALVIQVASALAATSGGAISEDSSARSSLSGVGCPPPGLEHIQPDVDVPSAQAKLTTNILGPQKAPASLCASGSVQSSLASCGNQHSMTKAVSGITLGEDLSPAEVAEDDKLLIDNVPCAPCSFTGTGAKASIENDVFEEVLQIRDMHFVAASVDRLLESLTRLVPDLPEVEAQVKDSILQSLVAGPLLPIQLLERTTGLKGNIETNKFANLVATCVRSLSSQGLITANNTNDGGKALMLRL